MGNDEKVSPRSGDPLTPEIVGRVPSPEKMDGRAQEALERARNEDTLEGRVPPSGRVINYQLLVGIREKVLSASPTLSVQQLVNGIAELYPTVKESSLRVYCLLARSTTSHLMTLYGTKKISFLTLKTLSTPKLDDGTKDFLGNEVVERGFTGGQDS